MYLTDIWETRCISRVSSKNISITDLHATRTYEQICVMHQYISWYELIP